MQKTHRQKMKRCLRICKGNKTDTALYLNIIMRDTWGKLPPKRVTLGIVDNLVRGNTRGVEYYIGLAMDRMIKDDDMGVKQG